jgi:hypothetical protein
VEVFPGGVVAHFSGHVIHAGNADFFVRSRIAFTPEEVPALYVSLDDRLLGELHLADQFRPGVEELVSQLNGFSMETVMMSPATQLEAKRLGKRLKIRDIHAELNEEKYAKTLDELIFETNGHAAFVTANEVPKLWKKASPGIQTGALQANHWAPVAICSDCANLLGPALIRLIRNARLMRFICLLDLFSKALLVGFMFVWEYNPMILAVVESLFTAGSVALGLMLARKTADAPDSPRLFEPQTEKSGNEPKSPETVSPSPRAEKKSSPPESAVKESSPHEPAEKESSPPESAEKESPSSADPDLSPTASEENSLQERLWRPKTDHEEEAQRESDGISD